MSNRSPNRFCPVLVLFVLTVACFSRAAAEAPLLPSHPRNTWIKRSPLADGPVSPRLGYEGACVWDSRHQLLVRYGGHNQGGGGEQGAEVWTFDLNSAEWTLREPNTSPPGVCCNKQNVYDRAAGRYIRFPKFSGSHGWQWWREIYLNDASVWTYDLAENRWRNMRPVPAPRLAPYRCASWDSDRQVVVVFGGEGSHEGTLIYDPWRNEWRWPRPDVEPNPRSGGSMAYDAARKLHVLFGSQFDDDRHTWTYDAATNRWRDVQPGTMPPTDRNDPELTYDPINQIVLALVKVTSGDGDDAVHDVQTWTYDAGDNTWTRMRPEVEPDAAGNRTRNLIFAPELNLAILEDCTSQPREQQIWTYRYAEAGSACQSPPADPRDAPRVVEDAVVSVLSNTQVEITWRPPAAGAAAGYHVERAVVDVWTDDQLVRLKQNTTPLAVPSVGAIRRMGPFQKLTASPCEETSFVDAGIDLRTPRAIEGESIYDSGLHEEHLDPAGRGYRHAVFAYRVRAVDATGHVGGPSPAVLTLPSAPQHVFSREDGSTCRIKWAANPEQAITGYRVYRMDGRWDKDPVSRLTAVPQTETTYADETAGDATRRYYIVAVDALGQEGFPSAPVWFNREWRAYYEPFTGPWHQ